MNIIQLKSDESELSLDLEVYLVNGQYATKSNQ